MLYFCFPMGLILIYVSLDHFQFPTLPRWNTFTNQPDAPLLSASRFSLLIFSAQRHPYLLVSHFDSFALSSNELILRLPSSFPISGLASGQKKNETKAFWVILERLCDHSPALVFSLFKEGSWLLSFRMELTLLASCLLCLYYIPFQPLGLLTYFVSTRYYACLYHSQGRETIKHGLT